jgi:hypothetical protein
LHLVGGSRTIDDLHVHAEIALRVPMAFRHAAVLSLVLGLTASAFAQTPRKDGSWEVTMEVEIEGMPAVPSKMMTQCVSKEDVSDPQKPLLGRASNNCTVSDHKVEGSKVSWSMKCEPPEAMIGSGEIVYGDDAYTGSMKIVREGRTIIMKYAGKRLGDCTK